MIYLLALLPATMLTVAGYVVLFLAARSEGGMRTFGKYLGIWAFILAALVILGGIFAAAHHGRHGWMHGGRAHMEAPAPDGSPPATTPAPETPTPPAR
jgi:hypothetical protein